MATNTIGTGAVVLTANADSLLVGLDKAGKATDQWAAKTASQAGKATGAVDKAHDKLAAKGPPQTQAQDAGSAALKGGKGGGGGLGSLGSLAAGAAGGLAVGVGMAAIDKITALPGMAKSLREDFANIKMPDGNFKLPDMKGLDSVIESVERISAIFTLVGGKIVSAFAPAMQTVASIAEGAFAKFGPIIDKVSATIGSLAKTAADVFGSVVDVLSAVFEAVWPILERVQKVIEVIAFVGGQVFKEIANLIIEVIQSIAEWIGSLIDMGSVTMTTSEVVFKGIRYIGYGFAYLWDTIKAGAGIVAIAFSYIVDGMARLVDAFKGSIKEILDVAGTLPDWLGGADFRKASGAIDALAGKIHGLADNMRKWGKGAIDGWGDSVKDVDKWVDKIAAKFTKQGDFAAAKAKSVTLSGAASDGSTEAYSIRAKFFAANTVTGEQGKAEAAKAAAAAEEKADRKKVVEELKKLNKYIQGGFGQGTYLGVVN